MLGFLNINKPSGVTSNYIVSNIRKKLKIKKVGHFGTLDPLASGVLPIAIGRATKLFDYFLEKEKEYIATFQFGYLTDTLDSEGKVIETSKNIPTEEEIIEILKTFIGKQNQIPPMYSAKNINGVRAYTLARMGEIVELAPKEIEIYDIAILEKIDNNTYKFLIKCSSGTYIRSIARDLGKKLNTFATMIGLIRTKSGCFEIENSVTIDKYNENDILKIEDVLKLPEIIVNPDSYKQLSNGVKIKYNTNGETKKGLVYCNGDFFGIGVIENNMLKIDIYLKEDL